MSKLPQFFIAGKCSEEIVVKSPVAKLIFLVFIFQIASSGNMYANLNFPILDFILICKPLLALNYPFKKLKSFIWNEIKKIIFNFIMKKSLYCCDLLTGLPTHLKTAFYELWQSDLFLTLLFSLLKRWPWINAISSMQILLYSSLRTQRLHPKKIQYEGNITGLCRFRK